MIKNKLIDDFKIIVDELHAEGIGFDRTAFVDLLEQKGYKVEKKRSKLEEARALYHGYMCGAVEIVKKYNLKEVKDKYEDAIKEIQEKHKESMDIYGKDLIALHGKQLSEQRMAYQGRSCNIDDDLIELLHSIRNDNKITYYNLRLKNIDMSKIAERLLKQLGY